MAPVNLRCQSGKRFLVPPTDHDAGPLLRKAPSDRLTHVAAARRAQHDGHISCKTIHATAPLRRGIKEGLPV